MADKKLVFLCLGILLLSMTFVSASWLGDFWNRVTGKEAMLSACTCTTYTPSRSLKYCGNPFTQTRSCTPDRCAPESYATTGTYCPEGTCIKDTNNIFSCCVSNCTCASTTCIGQICSNGCGGTCAGTKSCTTPCVSNCTCASNTCAGSTCSNGCAGTCAGTKSCTTTPTPVETPKETSVEVPDKTPDETPDEVPVEVPDNISPCTSESDEELCRGYDDGSGYNYQVCGLSINAEDRCGNTHEISCGKNVCESNEICKNEVCQVQCGGNNQPVCLRRYDSETKKSIGFNCDNNYYKSCTKIKLYIGSTYDCKCYRKPFWCLWCRR